MTEVEINKYLKPVAWQRLTGVVSTHRGNNLGLTLKYMVLQRLLERAEVEYWYTDNAGTNKYMIRINDILRYKEWLKGFLYEIEIDEINLK